MNLTDDANSMRSAVLLTFSIMRWKCALEKEQEPFKWMGTAGFCLLWGCGSLAHDREWWVMCDPQEGVLLGRQEILLPLRVHSVEHCDLVGSGLRDGWIFKNCENPYKPEWVTQEHSTVVVCMATASLQTWRLHLVLQKPCIKILLSWIGHTSFTSGIDKTCLFSLFMSEDWFAQRCLTRQAQSLFNSFCWYELGSVSSAPVLSQIITFPSRSTLPITMCVFHIVMVAHMRAWK